MYKTRLNKGISEKWGDCSNVSKIILKQIIEVSLVYCTNGTIGAILPMSKTFLNQGIEYK